jgi:hypothetical protein
MKAKVSIDDLWKEVEEKRGEKLTIREVCETCDLNDRTVTNARRGSDKSALLTLVKLRIFFERELGREISLDDLIEVTDE